MKPKDIDQQNQENKLELHQYRAVLSYCEMTFIASDDNDAKEHIQQWLTNHTNGFEITRIYMSNKDPWIDKNGI